MDLTATVPIGLGSVREAVREAIRRRDAQLVDVIAQALAPWPVRVLVVAHPGAVRITLGRPNGVYLTVPIDRHRIARDQLTPEDVATLIALEARRRWRDLDPLPIPANITLGAE